MRTHDSMRGRHGVDFNFVRADKSATFEAKPGRLRRRASDGSGLSGAWGGCQGRFWGWGIGSGTSKPAATKSAADNNRAGRQSITIGLGLVVNDQVAGKNNGLAPGEVGAADAEGTGLRGSKRAIDGPLFVGQGDASNIDGAVGIYYAKIVAGLFGSERGEGGRNAKLGGETVALILIGRYIQPGKRLYNGVGGEACRGSGHTACFRLALFQFLLVGGGRRGGGQRRLHARGSGSDRCFVQIHIHIIRQSGGCGFPRNSFGNALLELDRGCITALNQIIRRGARRLDANVKLALVGRERGRACGQIGGMAPEQRRKQRGRHKQHGDGREIQDQTQRRAPEQPGEQARALARRTLEPGDFGLKHFARGGMQFDGRAGILAPALCPGAERFFNVAFFGHVVPLVGRSFGQFRPGKNGPRDGFKAVEAFAEAGADGFGVEIEGAANFLVAEIAEVAEFDDFATGFAQLFERLVEEGHALGVHKREVRRRGVGGGIHDRTVGVVDRMQRHGNMPAAAFGGRAPLTVVARLVGGDAEYPGLELAVALEGGKTFYDGKKNFLGDFLDVFAGKIVRQLEDEAPGGGIVPVEQFVPGAGIACAAAAEQAGFRFGGHAGASYRPPGGPAIPGKRVKNRGRGMVTGDAPCAKSNCYPRVGIVVPKGCYPMALVFG